jgi:NADH:ubiquinone oxidoreductase subunit K
MLLNTIGYMLILTSIGSCIKNYKNNILILLSLELFFVGLAVLYINAGLEFDDFTPITIAVLILCLSATESALGLTILMINKKNKDT